jgi:hypothetical protein
VRIAPSGLPARPPPHAVLVVRGTRPGDPLYSVERTVINVAWLTRLNVSHQMAEFMMPPLPPHVPAATARDQFGATYKSLFKFEVAVVDAASGASFPVRYEGFVSCSQRHLRLTAGWAAAMRTLGVALGDTLLLERRTEDRFTLHLRVIKQQRERD